ncbi:hypothetical protein Tco_0511113 [Tanacetum coccineum]
MEEDGMERTSKGWHCEESGYCKLCMGMPKRRPVVMLYKAVKIRVVDRSSFETRVKARTMGMYVPKSPTDPPSSDHMVVLWRVREVVMLVLMRVCHGG